MNSQVLMHCSLLAFPYELSGLAATRPEVLSALSRILWEALRLRYRRWAKSAGFANGTSNAPPKLTPAEALTTVGLQRGTLVSMREGADPTDEGDAAKLAPPLPRHTEAVVHEREC